MAWTNISKPSANSWTRTNPQGREQYDDPSVAYDDSGVFYDGVNQAQWTDVTTPSGPTWNTIVGTWNAYTGTWDEAQWSKTAKPV